ncbi:MAG: hypothetical protein P9G45_05540 [Candidatus Contendobacter sp.]|nr:hypothetical protein [Candidatus Contendobacter sp.]
MTPEQTSETIDQLARRAYEDLLRRIRAGETPREAADAALAAFRGPYYQQVADALSAILKASIGPADIKAWPVGKVKLSQALYAHHRAISAATAATVNAHLQGLHSARDLAKTLYEGYDFKPDTLKVVAKLPKYLRVKFNAARAAKLKTPALRAAYLQAIQAAEAGAGQAELEKILKVAFYERNRYLANRIARTEIARAQNAQIARELLADEQIGFVQIRLSSKHPKTDICDLHAKLDAYGLGPGVYPKAEAPLPPFHPHCYCLQRPILSIPPGQKVKARPNAARAFLKSLPADEARQVMGGKERLRRVLEDGDSIEAVVNTNVDPLYHAKRMGEVADNPLVKAARLSSNSVNTLLAENEKLTIPARLHPVSAAFDFPDEPEYEPIRRALAAIDAAHDDGDLPALPIELARDLTDGNDGEYWGDDARAFKIRIAALSKIKEFSLACEVGHFLDHQALAPGQGYATLDPQGALLDVLLSIQLSKSAQGIQSYAHDAKAYGYLNDESEWWSRAYAQWVALRSGSAILKKQADHVIHDEVGFWEWKDFEPIAKAIDVLFRQKGWL